MSNRVRLADPASDLHRCPPASGGCGSVRQIQSQRSLELLALGRLSGRTGFCLDGAEHSPGCRENFLAELAKHKLGRRDIVANLNFFCRVPVGADNGLDPLTFVGAPSRPGDHIDLRAEMDVLGAISNCPQINNPCSGGRPTPIRVRVIEAHGG
jgi:hypothetical protein